MRRIFSFNKRNAVGPLSCRECSDDAPRARPTADLEEGRASAPPSRGGTEPLCPSCLAETPGRTGPVLEQVVVVPVPEPRKEGERRRRARRDVAPVPPSHLPFSPAARGADANADAALPERLPRRTAARGPPPPAFRSDSNTLHPADFFLDVSATHRSAADPAPPGGEFLDGVVTVDLIPVKSPAQKLLASVGSVLGSLWPASPTAAPSASSSSSSLSAETFSTTTTSPSSSPDAVFCFEGADTSNKNNDRVQF